MKREREERSLCAELINNQGYTGGGSTNSETGEEGGVVCAPLIPLSQHDRSNNINPHSLLPWALGRSFFTNSETGDESMRRVLPNSETGDGNRR